MKSLTASSPVPLIRRLLSLGVAGVMTLASVPALASAPAPAAAPAEPAGQVGGKVALLRFGGDATAAGPLREGIQDKLAGQGYAVTGVKRTVQEAADKNKCKTIDEDCRAKIGAYLNKNAATPFDFYVYGDAAAAGGRGAIVIYDIRKSATVREFTITGSEGDYVLGEVLPGAVARAAAEYQVPPGPLTADETKVMEELDEPKKSAEQIAKENAEIAAEADAAGANVEIDPGEQPVDLKKDFKEFCRTGPREDRIINNPDGTTDKERDLRPVCKRGPTMGYWQPRAYVALTLTVMAAAGTGLMYGLAAGAKGEWKDAKKTLDDSGNDGSTPEQNDCDADPAGCYPTLAGAVSEAGYMVKRRAIIGDVLLGTTVLLGAILGIIIYQDRSAAKAWIRQEKEMRLANFRIGPMLADEGGGGSLGFDF